MEAAPEEGESARVLTLFDLYWFRRQILRPSSPPPPATASPSSPMLQPSSPSSPMLQPSSPSSLMLQPSSPPSPMLQPSSPPSLLADQEDAESHTSEPAPPFSSPPTPLYRRHRRSLSDESSPFASLRIETPPRLQTILSGKEGLARQEALPAAEVRTRRPERRRRRRRKESSRSLSKLEFEELKGFMDLGFTFSEEEAADPRLRSLVPGLQRLERRASAGGDWSVPATEEAAAAEDDAGEAAVARPYLSEAWDAAAEAEEEELNSRLRNWTFPVAAEGVDLKDQLRLWAHTVASTVRDS